jgi:hypothetical protein
MKVLLSILIAFFVVFSANAATVYKWVDKKGVVHFTDDYDKIPAAYRDRVQKKTVEDSPQMTAPSPSEAPPQEREEVMTDRFGLGEAYWRDRVRPWKVKLAEATAKYESAHQEYMEKSEQLSQRKFGSRTQYKMNISELDMLNAERKKYEAEVNEANDMLKKISKEADEAKADPEWLK